MNLEIVNNEAYCSPQSLDDIQRLQSIEHNTVVVSFAKMAPGVSKTIIGCLMEMQRKGKNILVIYSEKFLKESLIYLKSVLL